MARYRLLARARADLAEIRSHILTDNPARAISFVAEIRARFPRLAATPGMGRARDDLAPGLRSFPHGRYLIFYRPDAEGITILRILHGAREIEHLL